MQNLRKVGKNGGPVWPQILDMRFQIALTSEHVMWPIFVEFRSASLESAWRKERKKEEEEERRIPVKYKSADMYVGRPTYWLLSCIYTSLVVAT